MRMKVDQQTLNDLEIFESRSAEGESGGPKTFFDLIDRTVTPKGSDALYQFPPARGNQSGSDHETTGSDPAHHR